MKKEIKKFVTENYIEIITKLMNCNNGYILSEMLEQFDIHRMYLTIMKNKGLIERVSKGVYIDSKIIEDSYYTLSISTPKLIYSHMTALYFHGLSIKAAASSYDITVPQKYNVAKLKNHNVFYVNDDVYELGLTEVKTPMGNTVKCYDIERCICDIIRSKKRMDMEYIKHSIREYIKRKDKDITKLSDYAEKLGIKDEVINFVSMMY
ncbi:MAG: type IV toxin-antitoxin system AbiEi family antitoxin domain-containing protein [Bacilli bacterium]